MAKFTHQNSTFLENNGAKIYYEIVGNQNRPALFMLHGGIGSIDELNPFVEALSSSYFIIGVDARGHGRSTLGDHALSYEVLQQDVEAVAASLGVKKCSLLGFSDGGITALRIALSHKLDVHSIVAIGTGWQSEKDPESIEMYKKIDGPWWKEKHPEYFKAYQKLNPEKNFNRLVESAVEMWLDQSKSGYPNERIRELKAKVLLIRGDDDHLVSLGSQSDFKSLLPETKFLNIPNAGHVAFEDAHDLCLEYVKKFLIQ